MSPECMMELCQRPVAALDGRVYLPDHIILVVPKKALPRARVRLAGRSGPLGRVCNVEKAPHGFAVVAVFNRKDVVAFLERIQREKP